MKTIEEKAKAYDEAIERAKKIMRRYPCDSISEHTTLEIFPQLAESEDEKIRKFLIKLFTCSSFHTEGIEKEQILAYLEKQKKQKPYGQREECRDCQCNYFGKCNGVCEMKRKEQKSVKNKDLSKCADDIRDFMEIFCEDKPKAYWDGVADTLEWIKENPNNQFSKPVEWSEEDEAMKDNILRVLQCFVGTSECETNPSLSTSYPLYMREMDWLKSLRPQKKWKPSEEQMNNLSRAIKVLREHNAPIMANDLETILNDLKTKL